MHRVLLLVVPLALSSSAARAQTQDPYPPQPTSQPQPPPPQPQPQPQPPPPQPYPPPPQPYPPPPQPYPPPPQPYPPPYYPPPPPGPETSPSDQPGELEMALAGAVLGIFGGIVVVDLRDIDDAGIATMTVLGTTAAGAGLGFITADQLNVKKGHADLCFLGMLVGAANGALLAKPLELHTDTEDWGPFVLGTTALGGASALALAMKVDYTRGQSLFTSTLAMSGLASTLLGVAVVQGGDLEDDDSALVSLALGLDAGLVVGLAVSPMVNWSYRRARFVSAATLVGAGAGLAGGAIITGDSKDPRTIGTAGLVGLWGGMLGGIAMTSSFEPDPRFQKKAPPGAVPAPAPGYTIVPAVGGDQVGLMVVGSM